MSFLRYHIFNVARGMVGTSRLSKKGGNYIGEMRSNALRVDHVMLNAEGNAEYGAISFRREGGNRLNPWLDGPQPRRAHMVLPILDRARFPVSVEVSHSISSHTLRTNDLSSSEVVCFTFFKPYWFDFHRPPGL